jgi:sugar O-acyltransferase (sialic acid O-acetyltransferase NeuD family)
MIAIGTKGSAFRYRLYQRLLENGCHFESIVHPSVLRAPTSRIGNNVVVMSRSTLEKNVTIGDLSFLSSGVTLEHDTEVGDNCFIGPGVVTAGHVRISSHAFVGVGAVIGPSVTIGERALIGAGAVVIRDVPAGKIAVGVPARVHGEVRSGCDAPTLEDLERFATASLRDNDAVM